MKNHKQSGGLAVFVKTPALSPVKTRLAAQLGSDAAAYFYRASLAATEAAVDQLCQQLPNFCGYWAVAEAEAMETPFWSGMPNLYQGEGDLGARLDRVYQWLVARHGFACLIGADSPQVPVSQWIEAVTRTAHLAKSAFVLGETLDGGFYFFGSGREIPSHLWTSIEYSKTSTAASLVQKLQIEAPVSFLDQSFDVDHAEDLGLLASSESHSLLPEQLSLVNWARNFNDQKL